MINQKRIIYNIHIFHTIFRDLSYQINHQSKVYDLEILNLENERPRYLMFSAGLFLTSLFLDAFDKENLCISGRPNLPLTMSLKLRGGNFSFTGTTFSLMIW